MLRCLKPYDIDFIEEWMKDEEVNKWFQKPFFSYTKEDILHFIENSFTESQQSFAIVNDNDEYIGGISLKDIDRDNRKAELSFVLRKEWQGKGFASKAIQEILEYAFVNLGLNKLYVSTMENNEACKRVLTINGFVYVGTFFEHIRKNNQYVNIDYYEILNNRSV